MSQPKTQVNDAKVEDFIESVAHPVRKADAYVLLELMQDITAMPAKMWGKSLIGFDSYKYTYESGHSGESFICGFSPRKQNLTVYIMPGFSDYDDLLAKLGKHKIGKSCLYINKLADVDIEVLRMLIVQSVQSMKEKYP